MKKIILYIVVGILFTLIFFVGIFSYSKYEENKRDEKILKNFENVVIWNLMLQECLKKM